jgi:structural maintenance of chromosome 4
MMKPKAQTPHEEGLLEYLEEIVGTNKYVEAIEKKNQEVEAANEERQGLFE